MINTYRYINSIGVLMDVIWLPLVYAYYGCCDG